MNGFRVCSSVTPFSLCSHCRIIMKFSEVIANDRGDVHAKDQGQRSKVKVTEVKTLLSRFRTVTPVELTYGDEMVHKAWCCLGEVPYCFSRSSAKFQGHTAKISSILTQIGCFQTVTPVWINPWLWNDAQSLKQHKTGALLLFKVIRQISRSHGTKKEIADFDPNWAFPDCNFSLNSLMAMKWCKKLDAA